MQGARVTIEKQQRILIGWALIWLALVVAVLLLALQEMSTLGAWIMVLAWFGGIVATLLTQQYARVRRARRDGVTREGPVA